MAHESSKGRHTKVFQTSIGCFRPPGSHLLHELTQILFGLQNQGRVVLLFLCQFDISRSITEYEPIDDFLFGEVASGLGWVRREVSKEYDVEHVYVFVIDGKRTPAMWRCHTRRGLSRVCEESSGTWRGDRRCNEACVSGMRRSLIQRDFNVVICSRLM